MGDPFPAPISRKTKTTAPKEEATTAPVPKLRFPEFRDAALRSVQLGDVPEEETAPPTPHFYFVDETGDGVIFDGKGRVLVGMGSNNYF